MTASTLEPTLSSTILSMHGDMLTVSKAATLAAVTPDTLRYYECLGLLPSPPRTAGGYRLYDRAVVERVGFIRKAQAMGLTLAEVREILRVAAEGTAPCKHVAAALARRMRDVRARIAELESLRRTLARALARTRRQPLATSCVCSIIESEDMPVRPTAYRARPVVDLFRGEAVRRRVSKAGSEGR